MASMELNLRDDQIKQLDELMQKTKLTNRVDLLNNALTLFEWAVQTKAAGRMVASLDEKSGTARELVLPALENVPSPIPVGQTHPDQ